MPSRKWHCANPDRFDTWYGFALTSADIETSAAPASAEARGDRACAGAGAAGWAPREARKRVSAARAASAARASPAAVNTRRTGMIGSRYLEITKKRTMVDE